MHRKCTLLNSFYVRKKGNYYFCDISFQNALIRNHGQRLNAHLVSHDHNFHLGFIMKSGGEKKQNTQRDCGRRMWMTGWGQVSGEWDEQQKIGWCIDDPSKQQGPKIDQHNRTSIDIWDTKY